MNGVTLRPPRMKTGCPHREHQMGADRMGRRKNSSEEVQIEGDARRQKMWPTPTENKTLVGDRGKMQKCWAITPRSGNPDGGTLNPTWVEWLMGYPKGWTDLKD
ncbi:MAG: hypothetical protein CM15mV49_260 [uncultured marine virus]|nr:MAG: hypothetical protein CM15mV49_260 [uncultured marine virus]